MGDKGDSKVKRVKGEGSKTATAKLPQTRAELLDLHRETRARRNAAAHGSAEHVDPYVWWSTK